MSDIRGFREVIGPDGEVTFEFASSSGEDSEEDVDYIPPAAALARRNAITNLNVATDWTDGNENRRGFNGSDDSSDSISSQESVQIVSDDTAEAGPSFRSAEVPGNAIALFSGLLSAMRQRNNGDEDRPEEVVAGSEEPVPDRSLARRTRSRRTTRAKKRRKRVVAKKRKPAPKKAAGPSKELPPLTIRHSTDHDGGIWDCKGLKKSLKVRVRKTPEDENGYKIGTIELVLEEEFKFSEEAQQVTDISGQEILEVISGIDSLEFAVSEEENLMLVRKERPASSQEHTELSWRHRQKARSDAGKNRIINVVIVEHFYFPIQIRGDVPVELLDGLQSKSMSLDFQSYHAATREIKLNIMLLESSILGVHDLDCIPVTAAKKKNLLCFIFGVESVQKIEPQEKEDIEWFYGQIRKYHQKESIPEPDFPLQHASMKPTLRDYQKAAVRWMLYKEGAIQGPVNSAGAEILNAFLEKLSVPVKIIDMSNNDAEKTVYYNPFVGYVSWERPQIPQFPSGGILADEMGLGKTVEVLALILLNPCPNVLSVDVAKSGIEGYESSEDESEESSASDCPIPRKKKKSVLCKRRRRSPSPCEYVAHNFDEEGEETIKPKRALRKRKSRIVSSSDEEDEVEAEGDESIQENSEEDPGNSNEDQSNLKEDQCNSVEDQGDSREDRFNLEEDQGNSKEDQDNSLEDQGTSSRPVRKARRKSSAKKEPSTETTYDKIKVLYDAQLSEYSAAKYAQPSKRFHGTFFSTTIQRKPIFECLCGEGRVDTRKVVQCVHCLSSQHIDCVNFDVSRGVSTYLCPHCEVSAEPIIDAKTTLIVTPTTISHQWIKEIQRHIQNKHMSILFYKGVAKHGYMPPYRFAEYDLVITTYSVLSADLQYVDLPHTNSENGRKFRTAKRFLTIPSSLPAVRWWRVCLDEAQMVEGLTTKMSVMASRLQGVHRWCITGTPLNKGLEDLHGLVAFLGLSPISQDKWWEYLVRVPFYKKDTSLLFKLFGQTIWRTGKQSVLNQLGIPPQKEIFHWLQFSPVEAHFYKRQYETCASKINAKIARLRQLNGANILQTRLSSLDRQTLHSLLQPFLELRQACCHPQMVRGNVINLQKLKGTMTMEDLLVQLMKKTKIQCMDDHRLILAALNGLAGLYWLSNRWVEAADCYRETLQRAEKHKEQFQTDSLQLLHALENLADILDGSYIGVGYTLNDDKLRPQAEEIRKKYLEKYSQAVRAAKDVVDPVTNTVIDLMENFNSRDESWWFKALRRAVSAGKDNDLIMRIKDDLTYKTKLYKQMKSTSIAHKFNGVSGLQHVLIEKIIELEDTRDGALEALDDLLEKDPSSFVGPAVYCHLRGQVVSYYKPKQTNAGFRCDLCRSHDRFLEYEALLFSAIENVKISRVGRNRQIQNFAGNSGQDLTSEERALILAREQEELVETTEHVNINILEDQRRQTWADSDSEKIIKALLSFAKMNGCSVSVMEDGNNHVKIFENMKKEFRLLRILWRQIYDQVSAIDELGQATTRLRLREGDDDDDTTIETKRKKSTIKALSSGITEKADKIMNIHVLQRHEVDLKIEQIKGDYETGKDSLAVHLGQLFYLDTLNKNGYGKKGAHNSDDCPICASQLGHEWCVLICGHSFCAECIKELGTKVPSQTFQCPLCRLHMKMSTVSFIDTRVEEEQPVAGSSSSDCAQPSAKTVEVKGSHSTKVEGVVETLLRLQDSHPREKVLVFSTWTDVLEIIGHALEQNDIPYCMLMSSAKSKFHEIIEKFKNREDVQALLIPIQSGSKGLNLIEATHVFLVEPIFNLASEAQAVGRVHRIGQTKPTYVHRFYVRKTIEEQLFEILKTHDVSSDEEGLLTVADLQQFFTQGTGNLMSRPGATREQPIEL